MSETSLAVTDKAKSLGRKNGVSDVHLSVDQFIKAAIASGYYKHLKSPADGYLVLAYGASLGMDPATAMSSIIMVSGRMTFTANFIAAQIKKSGRYRYKVLKKTDKECTLEFWEKIEHCTKDGKNYFEWEKAGTETFTVEMAKRAQLISKGPNWTSYPEAMCFARAITAGARTYCPDLFMGVGIYTPDEIDSSMKMSVTAEGDVVPDAEYAVSTPTPPPPVQMHAISKELTELMAKTGTSEQQLCEHFKVEMLSRLSPDYQNKAIQMLRTKASATKMTS